MPRLQKPESTRVHANGDARTLLLRWVATRGASGGAPDVRPSHRNTVNLFFQAEDGIRDVERSRGLGDVYKRQGNSLFGGLGGRSNARLI